METWVHFLVYLVWYSTWNTVLINKIVFNDVDLLGLLQM